LNFNLKMKCRWNFIRKAVSGFDPIEILPPYLFKILCSTGCEHITLIFLKKPIYPKTATAYPYCRFEAKGSLKNNLTFSHLIFRLTMHDFQLQNPRNSSLFLWFCSIGSYRFNPNLSANSVNLFLSEPLDVSIELFLRFGDWRHLEVPCR